MALTYKLSIVFISFPHPTIPYYLIVRISTIFENNLSKNVSVISSNYFFLTDTIWLKALSMWHNLIYLLLMLCICTKVPLKSNTHNVSVLHKFNITIHDCVHFLICHSWWISTWTVCIIQNRERTYLPKTNHVHLQLVKSRSFIIVRYM